MSRAPTRFPLSILMGFIGVLAVGLASMKVASEFAVQLTFLLAFVALAEATLGMLVRRQPAPWIGFALFGWSFILAASSEEFRQSLMTKTAFGPAATRVIAAFHPGPPRPVEPFAVRENGSSLEKLFYQGYTLISVPFSPADHRAWEAYKASMKSFEVRSKDQDRAGWIGGSLLGLTFALLGAIVGHLLDGRSTSAGAPYEAPAGRARLALPCEN
jgi:hypothetical protein